MDQFVKWIKKRPIIKAVLYPAVVARRSYCKKKWQGQKELTKEFTEELSALLCEDPIIHVKEFSGKFAVDIRSDLFFRMLHKKSYEPELVQLCLKYLDRDRDAIDIGANIGFFTILFAKSLSGDKRVLSIEPTKNALKRLRKNIKLNKIIEKVDIFEGVASNQIGSIEINTIEGKEEYSSLGVMKHPSISKENYTTEKVKSITIDKLVEQKSLNPGFIKVDVEGVEHLVFEGAQKVLENKRPIILSELSDFLLKENGSSAQEVVDLIKQYEYDVFDATNPSIKPGIEDFGQNILCFPKEMNLSLK